MYLPINIMDLHFQNIVSVLPKYELFDRNPSMAHLQL